MTQQGMFPGRRMLWRFYFRPLLLLASSFLLQLTALSGGEEEERSAGRDAGRTAAARCFPADEVRCLLGGNCTNGLHGTVFSDAAGRLHFARVRFPGTASTDEWRMIRKFEELRPRYGQYYSAAAGSGGGACPAPSSRLCFAPLGDDADLSLAFQSLDDLNRGSQHAPFDVVERELREREEAEGGDGLGLDRRRRRRVLLTTLREPGSYATKWYRMRASWDRVDPNLANLTFEEWIERAPWRMNFLTRVLGAEGDRRTTPEVMLQTSRGELLKGGNVVLSEADREAFLEDAHMMRQNDLGPGQSDVYLRALRRLQDDFVHVGLFHRLRESWDLLAHAFCWGDDPADRQHFAGADPMGREAIVAFSALRHLGIDADGAWERLRERNRLDMALLQEAERMMDERLAAMQSEKERGVLCNFLGKVEVTCGSLDDETEDEL